MSNDTSLINGWHFYTLEKRPIEAYLENLWWVIMMLLFSIENGGFSLKKMASKNYSRRVLFLVTTKREEIDMA